MSQRKGVAVGGAQTPPSAIVTVAQLRPACSLVAVVMSEWELCRLSTLRAASADKHVRTKKTRKDMNVEIKV